MKENLNSSLPRSKVDQPVIGYRYWKFTVADGWTYTDPDIEKAFTLAAMYQDIQWVPGINQAKCTKGHTPPVIDCECGIYNYHAFQIDDMAAVKGLAMGQLYGAVACSGEILRYPDGCRAEKARILAFCFPNDIDYRKAAKDLYDELVSRHSRVPEFSQPTEIEADLQTGVKVVHAIAKRFGVPVIEPGVRKDGKPSGFEQYVKEFGMSIATLPEDKGKNTEAGG